MLQSLNHITLAVNEISESLEFYVSILGMKPEVKWDTGAYLSVGDLWVCLSEGNASPTNGYSHISLSVSRANFSSYCAQLLAAEVKIWKDNESEGESLYFLDPNGHKLEIHVGDLASRLQSLKAKPYKGLQWF